MIRIIKIGGKLIENDAVLNGLCDELSACYRDSVLVHGGGSMAGQLSARLGIRTRMIDGRRITDRETLEVAVSMSSASSGSSSTYADIGSRLAFRGKIVRAQSVAAYKAIREVA